MKLTHWIGRTETLHDVAAPAPLLGLAATLDHAEPPWIAGEVPPLGHWLYFLPRALERDIAADGHPHKGGFLPPVELPRRMWAGGEFTFRAPIPVGQAITRRSTIADVTEKSGRSGPMVFVRVEHEISTPEGPALSEVHHIVYREAPRPGEAPPPAEPAPEGAVWRRCIQPDIVLLFRYSALTFNGHRIHYDRDYCREVEGYPGLIVHGPLTATLLMDLFLRHNPGARITGFRFRARRPLFDIHPLEVCGRPVPGGAELWAVDHQGNLAMSAEVEAA
ncbi:acyl-CoA dehydrogenase [Magnetospirillum sp. ME-1]|uniref:FAS1-like dehydratase domain-containing protein n=1 Tax=Magnetospirillum sp. ME-1 TaxID=1639348 RepID=UPI000A17A252|nr:MaoC family dehydratase N-terminal domain-containing protein [Magnetospirillum sp. ME-1]ARJ67196.1 acyl-CoA dehydrogenase [Magnetospirillum sp. ME-1]